LYINNHSLGNNTVTRYEIARDNIYSLECRCTNVSVATLRIHNSAPYDKHQGQLYRFKYSRHWIQIFCYFSY